MAGLGDIVQKAFYMGVGLAATASEQAGEKFATLRVQAQKLADEMVAKGEITTEEARKMVDDMIQSAQLHNLSQSQEGGTPKSTATEPRRIEILAEDEQPTQSQSTTDNVAEMRRQVEALQEELKRMKQNKA
jgi:polyhydroxyalkanoate synthesis regulator phasin